MLLYELLKEQVDDVAAHMTVFIMNLLLISQLLSLFRSGNLIKVNTGIFLNCINHGQTLERLAQIDLYLCIRNQGGTAYLLSHMTEHILCQIHHSIIIGVGLIQLHQGKLRIVAGVQSLVTEYTSNLVYALHAAYDQTL